MTREELRRYWTLADLIETHEFLDVVEEAERLAATPTEPQDDGNS